MKILTKLILISVCGFIASVIIFAFLIRPNLNQVGALYSVGITKHTQLKDLLDQIIAFKNSESDLNKVQNKDNILNSILERENLQVAIRELEAAALVSTTEEGMTIHEALNPTEEAAAKQIIEGNPDIVEVPYVVNISGTYVSLVNFLSYIEHLPHFTEATKVSLSTTTTNTDNSGTTLHSENLTGVINAVFFIRRTAP